MLWVQMTVDFLTIACPVNLDTRRKQLVTHVTAKNLHKQYQEFQNVL